MRNGKIKTFSDITRSNISGYLLGWTCMRYGNQHVRILVALGFVLQLNRQR